MDRWMANHQMGVEELDQDHAQLLNMVKLISRRIDDWNRDPERWPFLVREGTRYLDGFMRSHFQREEEYMRLIGYPQYQEHKQLHQTFFREQMRHFADRLDTEECGKDDVLKFLNSTYGWLILHVATADMAIVDKGVLNRRPNVSFDAETLPREIESLLWQTLNVRVHIKKVDTEFRGEQLKNAVFQKLVYDISGQEVTVIIGKERRFLSCLTDALWPDQWGVTDLAHVGFMQWTFDAFAVGFWRTLAARYVPDRMCAIKNRRFLEPQEVAPELNAVEFNHTFLFETDKGRFYTAFHY
jgi:hemerythrin-like metal-binding protein